MFYITLISSQKPLNVTHIEIVTNFLKACNITPATSHAWLAPQKAADIAVSDKPDRQQIKELRALLHSGAIDIFITPKENRHKKLLVADMDATIVTGETLDELADYAGLKDKISAITIRAMNGELDFKEALRERVMLLKDLPEEYLQKTLAQIKLNAGAKTFIQTMKQNGATCVLVSGGFTFFTNAIAKKAGFGHHHGNILGIKDNKLTGEVLDPILDKNAKLDFLHQYMNRLDLKPDDVLAIGDGANDLPMLKAAGLGIGYHPKTILINKLDNCIIHGDLTTALYAQGFTEQKMNLFLNSVLRP